MSPDQRARAALRGQGGLQPRRTWSRYNGRREPVFREVDPANGLNLDRTAKHRPASIAATGLAVASYPVGVKRGFMARSFAVELTLATLRLFSNAPRGPSLTPRAWP